MQLLAIDQGNSRTKFGLFRDGALQQVWTAPTNKTALVDDLRAMVFSASRLPSPVHLALCSVVPELTASWQRLAQETACPLIIITGASPTPLTNAYATPETLGPDRLMAAVAAADHTGAPVIPVLMGTATVVDAVSAARAYLGGMIALGIGTAADALAKATSLLWPAEWQEPAHAVGRSSDEALRNGLFYQQIGGLQAMIRATREEVGVHAPVVLTGGWAPAVQPHLENVALVDEYLVLRGIALTAAFSQ